MKNIMLLGGAVFAAAIALSGCGGSSSVYDTSTPPPPPPPTSEAEFSATLTINVPLVGDQEVPRVNSTQAATSKVELDEELMQIRASIDLSEVNGVEDAHIHSGKVGINGPVVFGFVQSDSEESDDYYGYGTTSESGGSGIWTIQEREITAEQLELLKSGSLYINVHTANFPSGELRGQILTDNFVLATFPLSGAQEVPAISTEASGDGYALIDTDNYNVHLVAVASGVDFATMAHIHTGRIGNNGGVLVDLVQSGENLGTWMTPENTQIDEETFAVLASGGHYVNIHTAENPTGEIRGQILTDQFALSTFALSGEQEVPSVTTDASGRGYVLVDTADLTVELVVLTEGVDNATAAHIHTGPAGENGDILVALDQITTEPGKWVTPAETAITEEILAVLISGGHYVNVHTPAFPNGEIRGQMFPVDGESEGVTETFVVTVANVGGTNVYLIDGENNPELTLERGGVYAFDLSHASNANHPLRIRTSNDVSFTEGVVAVGTPGQLGARVTFTVPTDAPSALKYYCTVHGNAMGNAISVID